MNSEQQIEWIEQYLEGQLTGEELKAFEQKMAEDPTFAAEVKLQREIAEAMTEHDVIDLSRKLRSIQHQKKRPSGGSGRMIIFRRLLQIAAGLAFLVAVYFVYENFNQANTPQELATRYFSPIEQISHAPDQVRQVRDDDSTLQIINELVKEINSLWQETEALYVQKNYDQALIKLQTIRQLDPAFETQSPDEFFFYEGLLLLHTGKPEPAIRSFDKVSANYTEKATWYSALAYLQSGDIENAKAQLRKIISTEIHPYKKVAEKLLREMDSLNPS